MSYINYTILALVLSNVATFYLTINFHKHEYESTPSQMLLTPKPQISEVRKAFAQPDFEEPFEFQTNKNNEYDFAYIGDKILNMEPGAIQDSLLEILVAGWFDVDQFSLAEWINQQPDEVNVDQAVAAFSKLSSAINPEISLEWAASINNINLREQIVRQVTKQFRSIDPNGFYEYMSKGGSISRLIASTGVAVIPSPDGKKVGERVAIRIDHFEEPAESEASILARRSRIAGSSSRPNNVDLNK